MELNEVNYEGEYEKIKPYAEMIGRIYAMKTGNFNSWHDLTQQYYTFYFDPKIISPAIKENKINRKYAHFIVKQRLKDYIFSRKWTYSTKDVIEHINLKDLSDLDLESALTDSDFDSDFVITNATLDALLSHLNDRQKQVLFLTKICGFNQCQVGEQMNLERSTVSRLVTTGMEVMRSYI
jgi:RNA polymerase sigma factor (sigma-70 family)